MTDKRWMAFVLLVLAALWVLPGACAQEPASCGSVGMAVFLSGADPDAAGNRRTLWRHGHLEGGPAALYGG